MTLFLAATAQGQELGRLKPGEKPTYWGDGSRSRCRRKREWRREVTTSWLFLHLFLTTAKEPDLASLRAVIDTLTIER
jgi:hypothetical protein